MVEIVQFEMFANKTSFHFGRQVPKVRPISTNPYWKLIFAFAILHFFTNLLRYADASPVPMESRPRRHFPIEPVRYDQNLEKTSENSVADSTKSPKGKFIFYLFIFYFKSEKDL